MRPPLITKLRCARCTKRFFPSYKDKKLLNDGVRKRMTLVIVECSACGGVNSINPLASLEGRAKTSERNVRKARPLRCPVSGCSGWVSKVLTDERSFHGCGECGSMWVTEVALFRDIKKIIKKYPYRKRSYRETAGAFNPTSLRQENKGYEELVEREPKGKGCSFRRD